jgi:Predicted membrane protein (DUF2061)
MNYGLLISRQIPLSWSENRHDTLTISFLLTHTIALSLSIAAVEVIFMMMRYYFHERVWEYLRIR